ncbi:hypothetical protein [Myxococcus vastator]|uniref:hypothetical protein n=1 Tax=Myxococcus vastator TaxID=2709664 RepID=UPI0013D2DFA2|nr:hypothetical protein [Myxococcus vastator]
MLYVCLDCDFWVNDAIPERDMHFTSTGHRLVNHEVLKASHRALKTRAPEWPSAPSTGAAVAPSLTFAARALALAEEALKNASVDAAEVPFLPTALGRLPDSVAQLAAETGAARRKTLKLALDVGPASLTPAKH